MRLSSHGQNALDGVRYAEKALRDAKRTMEEEFRRSIEERLGQLIEARNVAVRLADEAGVPRTQIGRAMGTTNYRTVQDILEGVQSTKRAVETDSPNQDGSWSVHETSEGWRLTIQNLGVGNVSGSAIVAYIDGDLIWVDGDEFVIPNIYRNGLGDEVKQAIGE